MIMEANIYDDVTVVVRDGGNVVLINDNSIIELPVLAVEYIADNSKFAIEVHKELEHARAEIQRQLGLIHDLKGDLTRVNNKCNDNAEALEIAKAKLDNANDSIACLKDELEDADYRYNQLQAEKKGGKKGHNKNVEPEIAIKGIIAKSIGGTVYTLDDEVICELGDVNAATRAVIALKEGLVTPEGLKYVIMRR